MVLWNTSQLLNHLKHRNHSLLHTSQSLAANSLATFEIGLCLREIYGPARQCSLLQNPTALVERTLDDISTEVIYGLANVERFFLLTLYRDKLALPSVLEKAVVLMHRTTGS